MEHGAPSPEPLLKESSRCLEGAFYRTFFLPASMVRAKTWMQWQIPCGTCGLHFINLLSNDGRNHYIDNFWGNFKLMKNVMCITSKIKKSRGIQRNPILFLSQEYDNVPSFFAYVGLRRHLNPQKEAQGSKTRHLRAHIGA